MQGGCKPSQSVSRCLAVPRFSAAGFEFPKTKAERASIQHAPNRKPYSTASPVKSASLAKTILSLLCLISFSCEVVEVPRFYLKIPDRNHTSRRQYFRNDPRWRDSKFPRLLIPLISCRRGYRPTMWSRPSKSQVNGKGWLWWAGHHHVWGEPSEKWIQIIVRISRLGFVQPLVRG